MASPTISLPPPVLDDSVGEIRRIEHTRLRRRLLYGEFEGDLVERLMLNIGHVRRAAWGQVDMTANPFLSMWQQAAALYDTEPKMLAPPASVPLLDEVAELGFWAQQQRVQRDALGLREMLVRVDAEEDGPLSFRPVFPDMVTCESRPRQPSVPVRVREWVEDPNLGWVRHDVDVRVPAAPRYVVTTTKGDDVTGDVLGGQFSGGAYPFREDDGTPILPYGMYHSAATGCLFDPYTFREVVEGSLNICVLLTFYGHLVRNAAWAQRYAVNLEPLGLDVIAPEGERSSRRDVVTDPATLLLLRAVAGEGQPLIGQWSSPGDPEAVLRSINMYERRIQLIAGFAPPDVTRQEADIRSGYSLAVDREALRARQRTFEPQFRRADQNVLRIAACLSNRARGTGYSENATDYRVDYQGLPESPAEVRLRLDEVAAKKAAGMLGPVSALREFEPALTYDEAVLRLASASAEKADVDEAVGGLLAAKGIKSPPPIVEIDVGKMVALAGLLEKAQAGLVPVESVKELAVAMGLPPERADALVAPIVVRAAATPPKGDPPEPEDDEPPAEGQEAA